jgi:hypothetical protein
LWGARLPSILTINYQKLSKVLLILLDESVPSTRKTTAHLDSGHANVQQITSDRALNCVLGLLLHLVARFHASQFYCSHMKIHVLLVWYFILQRGHLWNRSHGDQTQRCFVKLQRSLRSLSSASLTVFVPNSYR